MIATDITHLLALINAGDDSVLPILADALEEQGDARAEGLRQGPYRPGSNGISYFFRPLSCFGGRTRPPGCYVSDDVYDRLRGDKKSGFCFYASRSLAFLALAEALAHV